MLFLEAAPEPDGHVPHALVAPVDGLVVRIGAEDLGPLGGAPLPALARPAGRIAAGVPQAVAVRLVRARDGGEAHAVVAPRGAELAAVVGGVAEDGLVREGRGAVALLLRVGDPDPRRDEQRVLQLGGRGGQRFSLGQPPPPAR